MSHPRLTKIEPLPNFILKGTFTDGLVRVFDVKPLIARYEAFEDLVNINKLFEHVHLDAGGYGVAWNDRVDLDAEAIYYDGEPVEGESETKFIPARV